MEKLDFALTDEEIRENELFGLDEFRHESTLSENERQFIDRYRKGRTKNIFIIMVTVILILVVITLSFVLGRYQVAPLDVLKLLLNKIPWVHIAQTWEDVSEKITQYVRSHAYMEGGLFCIEKS